MLLAVAALSAVVVSSALAAEGSILNAGTSTTHDLTTATFESTGSSIIVKSTQSKGETKATSSTTGTFVEHFEKSTAGGFAATGLGDASGVITVKGTYELLDFVNSEGKLDLAIIFTIEPVHFEALGILTEVRGSVIGLITTAAGTKTKSTVALLKGTKGKESITEVNGVKHHLESETNGSAFVESDQNQEAEATGANEVEVMY